MARKKYWLVTLERQFSNTDGKRHMRTFVTDKHPLEHVARAGHPDPKYSVEDCIVFMAEIDKATYDEYSHLPQ